VQDAHNHLQDPRFDDIRKELIATMIKCGINQCVVNGTSPSDWPKVAELAAQYPDLVIPSFGLHPWQKPSVGWQEQLLTYLDTIPQACIGECGLDRWIKGYDIDLQTEVFITQLALAAKRNLPLSIHCLKAWGALLEILESQPLPKRGFLLHSYSGSSELVPRLEKLGAYFSFSGYFLRQDKQNVRDAFLRVSPDRLLIETDAPDMLPPGEMIEHPLDQKLNHPANLKRIYAEAANFLDTSKAAKNFQRFFEQ
jgi:TatD DNase family protein